MNEHLEPPPLPPGIRDSLRGFRSSMRRQKLTEAAFATILVALLSFLAVAGLDRLVVVHPVARFVLLAVAVAVAALVVPRAMRRWYWRHHDLEEVAREVTLRDALVGDRLLGIFELSTDREEFARSPELVRAAIAQGEEDLGGRSLGHALPVSRHGLFGRLLVLPVLATAAFAIALPDVAGNAFMRWVMPFGNVERYTFARIDGLNTEWFVPIQEQREVALTLAGDTESRPEGAEIRLGRTTVTARLEGEVYRLEVPPLAREQEALLVVGDLRQTVQLLPRERPEVTDAVATITLPEYLEIEEPRTRDVRGGALSTVEGSIVSFDLTLSRALATATLVHSIAEPDGGGALPSTGVPLTPTLERISSAETPTRPGDGVTAAFEWVDVLGLEGHGPFSIGARSGEDEAPAVATSGAERELVLLQTTALTFDVLATDDFGVRLCGLEWFEPRRSILDPPTALGDKVLLATGPETERAEAFATFRPSDLGVEPGSIELRAWAVDSLPGRERSYSTPIRVEVMTSEQHMEWVSRRFDRWMQQAIEVRDRELELFAENEALFELSNEELDSPGARSRIEAQAAAERANRSRLKSLVGEGGELLNQAARNSDIGSNTLDDWAEANAKLKKIAEQDMESVSKLLAKAARAEASGETPPGQEASMAGTVRASGAATPAPPPAEDDGEKDDEMPPTPTILDVESSLVEAEAEEAPPPAAGEKPENQGPAPIGLVGTTLGPAPGQAPPEEGPAEEEEEKPSPTKEELAKAIAAQKALIAEFNEVAGEIQQVLANLENSTFVKRLKAASRKQTEGADGLSVAVSRGFGSVVATSYDDVAKAGAQVADLEQAERKKLGDLYTDLDAYTDRLTFRDAETAPKFQKILDEWNDTRPVFLAEDLVIHAEGGRPGEARMAANFLADTLDRWGEELVGPG